MPLAYFGVAGAGVRCGRLRCRDAPDRRATAGPASACVFGGTRPGHREQFRNSDEFESLRFKLIEGRGHRFDRRRMNIVR